MARIAAEARVEEKVWSLVFEHAGGQKRLRARGFFAGHDSKERLLAGLEEELLKLNTEINEGGEKHVVHLGKYLITRPSPDSSSKTGVKRSNSSVVIGKSTDPRRHEPPPHASAAHHGRREHNGGSEESNISKIGHNVVARESEACVSSSGASLSSPSAPSAENNERRKFVTAAESFLSGERTPEQLLPVLSPKVLAAAGPRAGTAPVHMDEGSESSLDLPVIQSEVDNFVIHADYKISSVTTLPVYIDGALAGGAIPRQQVFLVGTVGPDCEMYKEKVEMWRLVLDPTRMPRFLLKTNKNAWVRLLNPDDSYKKIMREVHVLGHFLNFVKKLPNATQAAAEQDLQKTCRCHFCPQFFSLFNFWHLRSQHDIMPTLDRLSRHIKVIRNYIEYDDEFAKAPLLRRVFPNLFSKKSSPETPGRDESYDSEYDRDITGVKRKAGRLPLKSESPEKKEKRYKVMTKKNLQKPASFRVSTPELHCHSDDNLKVDRSPQYVKYKSRAVLQQNNVFATEEDITSKDAHRRIFTKAESEVEDPPICVLCDDGGSLLYCDGPCHRHFHASEGQGVDSFCATLGLSAADVKVMGKFFCPNCKHKQQQCFICGELGSSVATADGPQKVRCCDISVCHRFFHVDCVARTLCESNNRDWRDLSTAINDGREKLYCPRHCCSVCGDAEMEEPGLLVQCRRCPKAWHRECLVDFSRSKELESTLIWNHYDREFIYCRDHKIVPKLQTPARTHVVFPDI